MAACAGPAQIMAVWCSKGSWGAGVEGLAQELLSCVSGGPLLCSL